MKRCAFAVVVCLLFATISFAQQSAADAPASKQDIERYFDAMHSRDLMKSMMDLMAKQMHRVVHEQVQKQPNLPADFETRANKTMDDMLKDLPLEELIQAMTPAYQKYMTKGEVDALVAFYSTPDGQKFLKDLPAIQAESIQSATGIMQKMMAKMEDRLQREMAQVQKENDGNSKPQPQSTPN
jgi:uncharacterized protein